MPVPRGPMVNEVQRCLMEKRPLHTQTRYTHKPLRAHAPDRERLLSHPAADMFCCYAVIKHLMAPTSEPDHCLS